MGEFFQQIQPWHLVALAGMACATYIARHLGRRVGRSIVELNDNLKLLNSTIHKVDLLWTKYADAGMWSELEKKERLHAKA